MKLKLIITLVVTVLCTIAFSSCNKDDVAKQESASTFYPRIFNDTFLFPVPAVTTTITIGQSKAFTGLTYSPASNVQITWKVNDTAVATSTAYTFVGTTKGLFTVKLEVVSNGLLTYRTAKIQVN